MTILNMKVLVAALAMAATPLAAEAPREVTTIAAYPHGAFLENLSVTADQHVLFTSYFAKTLFSWNGDGAPVPFAVLDVHPVAVLARGDGIVLTAHGRAFTEGPAFTATNQFLVLDAEGKELRRIAAPDALFLNGMVEIQPGLILAADSIAGKIWALDLASGAISAWLTDPWLGPDPAKPSMQPAANGLKLSDGWLYISNSARGAIARVKLAGATPEGSLEPFVTTGSVDDFAFLADGSIAAASHGARLIRIAADRSITDILATGCDACTAVVPFGPAQDLIVLTTGNLVEGGDAPARVLRVPSPLAN